ncbi:MAG: glycoside hydrolase family 66 protein [Anaerolineales bacterium]
MRILDCVPVKGAFRPGELIRVIVRVESEVIRDSVLRVRIWHLNKLAVDQEEPVSLQIGIQEFEQRFQTTADYPKGYGVAVELMDENNEVHSSAATAFDVLEDWTERPRYGFLTDFGTDRHDVGETVDTLVRYHINGLQFYDWQYRHDSLLSPTEEYSDPLGRQLSLRTVKEFIQAAHDRGLAAMPYLAIYAASLAFWKEHQDWALYNAEGKPVTFEGFLGLMDPSPDGPWIDHLLDECDRVIANTTFDGLHVDQYGEPKEGYNASGDKVDIPSAFNSFICLLKKRYKDTVVTFNAVGNWPNDQLAKAPQDFMYIEVWPDTPDYADLLRIVQEGRQKSRGKPVVIALYQPAEWPENLRLTDAVIMACGGSRIEIGENERLLTDPYFPNHSPIPEELRTTLIRYHDFLVRYGDLIGPQALDEVNIVVKAPGGVRVVPRKSRGWLAISLINFSGLGNARWDKIHAAPKPFEDTTILISGIDAVEGVWLVSPDRGDLTLQKADWEYKSGSMMINLQQLDYWTLVAVKTNETSHEEG